MGETDRGLRPASPTNTHRWLERFMSDQHYPAVVGENQTEQLLWQLQSLVQQIQAQMQPTVSQPLRRDYVSECLHHTSIMCDAASRAVMSGEDVLFEREIERIRMTLHSAMQTWKEVKNGGKDVF